MALSDALWLLGDGELVDGVVLVDAGAAFGLLVVAGVFLAVLVLAYDSGRRGREGGNGTLSRVVRSVSEAMDDADADARGRCSFDGLLASSSRVERKIKKRYYASQVCHEAISALLSIAEPYNAPLY